MYFCAVVDDDMKRDQSGTQETLIKWLDVVVTTQLQAVVHRLIISFSLSVGVNKLATASRYKDNVLVYSIMCFYFPYIHVLQ